MVHCRRGFATRARRARDEVWEMPASGPVSQDSVMFFSVQWIARTHKRTGLQAGVPNWDEEVLILASTRYTEAQWSSITIYSDATTDELPEPDEPGAFDISAVLAG